MEIQLHHIKQYALDNYTTQAETLLKRTYKDAVIVNLPVAIREEDGKFVALVTLEPQGVLDILNDVDEENTTVNFEHWEDSK